MPLSFRLNENCLKTASSRPFKSHSSRCASLLQYSDRRLSTISSVISKRYSFGFSPVKTWRLRSYTTSRCLFITSSYSRRCFLISKLCASTFFWAFSIALETMPCSIGTFSSIPSLSIILAILSEPNILRRSSSNDKKNLDEPGSPCLPERPLN